LLVSQETGSLRGDDEQTDGPTGTSCRPVQALAVRRARRGRTGPGNVANRRQAVDEREYALKETELREDNHILAEVPILYPEGVQ
jgi:hypothetical protein